MRPRGANERMGIERRWLAGCLAVFLGGCVEIDDPHHCANRDGDATCRELYGMGAICTACDHFHHGCVDEAPPPECRVESELESESSSEETGEDDDAEAGR
jgi:hypothetical protein